MLSTHPHETSLPSPEERRKIMERAGMVLAQARSLMDQLDRSERQLLWSRQTGSAVAAYSSWQAVGGGLAAAIAAGAHASVTTCQPATIG